MIEIIDLCKAFDGKVVLEHFDLKLEDGQRYALMGTSGSGKTTLLNLIMGLIQPDSGHIIAPQGLKISAVFQENRLIEGMTPAANIRLVAAVDNERIRQVLLALGRQLQNMDANELMDKVGEIMEHVQTSLDTEELKELATVGMIVEIDEVLQFRLPADGTYDLSEKDGLAVLLPNFTKNKELLREFIYVTEFDEAAQAQP